MHLKRITFSRFLQSVLSNTRKIRTKKSVFCGKFGSSPMAREMNLSSVFVHSSKGTSRGSLMHTDAVLFHVMVDYLFRNKKQGISFHMRSRILNRLPTKRRKKKVLSDMFLCLFAHNFSSNCDIWIIFVLLDRQCLSVAHFVKLIRLSSSLSGIPN